MIELDNDFYCIEKTPISQNANLSWRGKAKILRKDTNEMVDQCSVRYGHSPQEVENQLDAALQEKLANLQKPLDWVKDLTIPGLIRRYLAIRDKTYGFILQAKNAVSVNKAKVILYEGNAFEAAALHELKKDIMKLSESQKIELVTPTPQQIEDPQNPQILDDLNAKKMLYTLIDNPSLGVKASYHNLEKLLDTAKRMKSF